MGYPVVHFEINTASRPELRFYADAFGWSMQPDGDDYIQIQTNGVCAGTGAPGSKEASARAIPATTS